MKTYVTILALLAALGAAAPTNSSDASIIVNGTQVNGTEAQTALEKALSVAEDMAGVDVEFPEGILG